MAQNIQLFLGKYSRRKSRQTQWNLKPIDTMKKETWKTILQVIASILTAALTALGTTSCMGHGPF